MHKISYKKLLTYNHVRNLLQCWNWMDG